jgi:hypothetical protein
MSRKPAKGGATTGSGGERRDVHGVAKVGQTFDQALFCWSGDGIMQHGSAKCFWARHSVRFDGHLADFRRR